MVNWIINLYHRIFKGSKFTSDKDALKTYQLQFSPDYWIQLEKSRKTKLWFNGKIITLQSKISFSIEFLFSIISALRSIALQVSLSIILVLILQYANSFFHFSISIDSNAYIDILTTLAQISGIFIGLYLTAISVVLSSAYVKVPENVRSLFLHTMGQYPKIVAILGSVSIFLLMLNSLNVKPSFLNLVLVTILGIISIFTFLKLVFRIFRLFNPNGLIINLISEITNVFKLITFESPQWDNPVIQRTYQIKVEYLLKTFYDILNDISINKKLEGESINKLSFHAIDLLEKYSSIKFLIPIESRWFKLNPKYPNWLAMNATDSPRVDRAVQTKTTLNPSNVPDSRWFEKKIELLVDLSMRTHIKRDDFRSAIFLIEYVNNILIFLSEKLAISEAITFLHIFDEIINLKSHNEYNSKNLNEKEQFYIKMGLIDAYAVSFMDIILGFHKSIGSFKAEDFTESIKKINWNDEKTLYEHRFHPNVINQLKSIKKALKFEYDVEGNIITPQWYQTQLSALEFARLYSSTIDELILEIEKTYVNNLKILLTHKQYIFTAQYIQRGLETCDQFQIYDLKRYFDEISKLRRINDGLWPKIDWNFYDKKLNKIKKHLLINLSKILTELGQIPYLDNLPDYFGQSYRFVTAECFETLINNDLPSFKKFFPPFLFSSLFASIKITKSGINFNENDLAIISTEPIINLLDMSSYAVIFSELYGDEDYWIFLKETWDKYFDDQDDPTPIIKYLMELVSYHPFKITEESFMRTKWEQKLRTKMIEELNLSEKDIFGHKKHVHSGPIINYLLQMGLHYLSVTGIRKIFLAKYIMGRPEAQEIEIKSEIKSLIDILKNENSKEN
ncbi:MAG: hypothetical protein ACLQG5_03825 [Methanobacterium sp.]